MTSESKILTVSYGTFSCTLEGFDDPFNTMKAIAEYFRDLSAEDRYFGAVPPQPDAAMLHRVADREVSRLTGSKARDAGLVLRPGDLAQTEGRVTGRPRTARAPVDEPAPPVIEPALQDLMPSGVVAKLARIREAVSQPLDETSPEDLLNAFREEFQATEPESDIPAVAEPVADATGDAASRIGALLQNPEADAAADAADANIFADLAGAEPAGTEPATDFAETVVSDAALAPDETEAPFIAVEDFVPELVAEDAIAFADAGVTDYEDDPLQALETLTAAVEAEAEAAAETSDALFGTEAPLADVSDVLADLSVQPLPVGEADPKVEIGAPLPLTRSTGKSRHVSSRVVRIHPADNATRSKGKATRMVGPDEAEEVARLLRQADDVMAEDESLRRLDSLAHLKAAVAATDADRDAGEEMRSTDTARTDAYRDDLAQVVQPDAEPAPKDVRPRRKTVSEIGRASCRERVLLMV